jgi:prephenate dehydrogenase
MPVHITLIGLGQIGTSIGLALAEHTALVTRTGHDLDPNVARRAQKLGAFDRVEHNLPAAVRSADLVLLALPLDQVRDTLEVIASELKEGAVVMDTAPAKEAVAGWVKALLPAGRYYIGLSPVLNPAYLQEHDYGIEAARADLFRGGLMGLIAPLDTPAEAMRLATDLTHLLGAAHIFVEAAEIDGLMAATHLLPQLLAAVLANTTIDQPGWSDGRKLAGRAYAEVTGALLLSEPQALADSTLTNAQNTVRVLDSLLASLQALRADIRDQNRSALLTRLERARRGRLNWWEQRQKGDWGTPKNELPSPGEAFKNLLGLGKKK